MDDQEIKEPKRSDSIFALAHEGKKQFTVPHVTIRQSIFFLLLKLIVIDIFAIAAVFVFFSSALIPIPLETKIEILSRSGSYLIIVLFLKLLLTVYVILLWLNDYYELTTEVITHRHGIFWQKEDSFKVTHIKNYGIRQGVFGKLFNYGSLHFYDWFLKQEYDVYLIHNPRKYLKIFEEILPFADEDREMIRQHIVEPGDE